MIQIQCQQNLFEKFLFTYEIMVNIFHQKRSI